MSALDPPPAWRRVISRAGLAAHLAARRVRVGAEGLSARRIRRGSRAPADPIRVAYAHLGFPASPRAAPPGGGGGIKYLWMEDRFPHGFPECDVVYAVSSSLHPRAAAILDAARRAHVPVVWNQNGAYFPHSYGHERAARGNAELAALLRRADYVFYQSEFAKVASHHFLGPCVCPCEVLHNAVDAARYAAAPRKRSGPLTILAAGSHDDAYRIPLVLDTFECVRRSIPNARLIIAGRVPDAARPMLRERIARMPEGTLEFVGSYPTARAPEIFSRADVFVHAKQCDVCPSVVLEAMAAGLPVAYSATGGTPELVGEAGIGVPGSNNWDRHEPPAPEALAQAVIQIGERLSELSACARERVAARFDLRPWLDRHAEIFMRLLAERRP